MKWIILSRSKLAAQTTSQTCAWKQRHPTPGFHQKDQFENFEHGQVCNGTISVAEAQSRMVSDWYFYWQEEVEGATPAPSAPVQSAPPLPHATTTADASPAYYTSSYHTATYGILRPVRAGKA